MSKVFPGNLEVFLESEEFGYESFNYEGEEEMFSGLRQLLKDAKEAAADDGIERNIGIRITPICCGECEETEGVQSTYCGSLCHDCLREHIKECVPCRKDFAADFEGEEDDGV